MTNRPRFFAGSLSLAPATVLSLFLCACMIPDSDPATNGPRTGTVDSVGMEVDRKDSVYLDYGARDTVAWDSAWSPFVDSLGSRTDYYRLPFMGYVLLLKRTNQGWLAKGACGGWPTDFHYLAAGPGQSLFRVNEPCDGIRRLDRWHLQPLDHAEIYNGGPCARDITMGANLSCLILQEGDRRLKIHSEMAGSRLLIGQEMSLQEIQELPENSLYKATGLRASLDLGEAPLIVTGENTATEPDTLREIAFQGAHLRFSFTPSLANYGGDALDSLVLSPGQALYRAGTSCEEFGVWDPADMVPVPGYRIRFIVAGGYETAGLDRARECLLFRDGEIRVKLSPWVRYQDNVPVQMMDLESMALSRLAD